VLSVQVVQKPLPSPRNQGVAITWFFTQAVASKLLAISYCHALVSELIAMVFHPNLPNPDGTPRPQTGTLKPGLLIGISTHTRF
jgi:hypothetical protein